MKDRVLVCILVLEFLDVTRVCKLVGDLGILEMIF